MKTSKFILWFMSLIMLACSSDVNIDFPNNFPPNNCLSGQGSIVSENRTLADFHSINTTIVADIFLTQGPKEDIIIEAQQNILDVTRTEVVNGELRLSFDRCVNILQRVKVHITIPDIKKLTLTGVGDIIAQNDYDLSDLNVTLTGVGDVSLRGIATMIDITITGVGDVEAFELVTNICDVRITGVGDAEVFVNDELNITITGDGTVFYKGNPTITSTITGNGRIVDAN